MRCQNAAATLCCPWPAAHTLGQLLLLPDRLPYTPHRPQAQYASIAPQAIRRFTFELQMETDQAIANASCSVAATDARGVVSATTAVTFYTNATKWGLGCAGCPCGQHAHCAVAATGAG